MAEQWNGNAGDEADERAEVLPEVREEFERMKRTTGTFRAFTYGKEMGIPQEELAVFIRATVAEKRARGEYEAAARLLQTTGVGTPEEILAAAKAPSHTTEVAGGEDVEGEEDIGALMLPRDATFADFADVGNGEFLDAFDAVLEDILGSKGAERILDLLARHVGTERVRDVFAEYGLDEDAVAEYFFIRFEK